MIADDKEVITVAQTKINMMMANDREKENHDRDAAVKYIERQPTIIVRDPKYRGRRIISHCVRRFAC